MSRKKTSQSYLIFVIFLPLTFFPSSNMWQGTHFLPVLSTYTANYSYNDCVQDEMLDAIEGEIGCQQRI